MAWPESYPNTAVIATGAAGRASFSRRYASYPPMSGGLMSSSTASNGASANSATPSAAVPAASVSAPSRLKSRWADRRFRSSGSTTSTRLPASGVGPAGPSVSAARSRATFLTLSLTDRAPARMRRRCPAASGSSVYRLRSTAALPSTSSTGRAISLLIASIDWAAVQLCWAVNRSMVCRAAAISLLNSSVNCRSSAPKLFGRGLSTLSVPITSSWYFSGTVIELLAPAAPCR